MLSRRDFNFYHSCSYCDMAEETSSRIRFLFNEAKVNVVSADAKTTEWSKTIKR